MPCTPVLHVQNGDDIPVGKIICLARTYARHAMEMGSQPASDLVMFLKPASAVIHDGGTIRIPHAADEVHHEVEMAVVIGRRGCHIAAGNAARHIYGYAVAVDVTARDLQHEAKQQGLPWTAAKGYDTFCPISSVVPASRIAHPDALELSLSVNGTLRQTSTTARLIHPVEDILAQLSDIMTLCPGDLILTGTPEGVGPLHPGDVVEARLDDCCHLRVSVE